ncbi:MAG: hypothetical protein VKJ87_03265 [Synechococcus sp.]|nr:hypothetical protein [Synechococcus sp.]
MGYRQQLESGHSAFAALLKAWHERNGWSHRVLPALAETLDLGRLHSSQLSNLRNRKLYSPGPEVFLALGGCNHWLVTAAGPAGLKPQALAQLEAQQELQLALERSALPLLADDGSPLGAGELLEIFVGLRPMPAAFDWRIAETEAAQLSAAMAELLSAGQSWRHCREAVMQAYPAQKKQRRERFAEVMAGLREYGAAELDAELPDLLLTLQALGLETLAASGPEGLLERLRQPG